MKRSALLCGALLLFAGMASAQDGAPKVEVFGGYSYLHVSENSTGTSYNGGSGSISYNPNAWLGLVGDFGGYHWSQTGADANVITYLFGPKITYRHGQVTPYAQVLFGGARISGTASNVSASQDAFAMTAGGGVDWNATPHIGIRLIQAEYLMTKFKVGLNDRQNNARISTGVVFRW